MRLLIFGLGYSAARIAARLAPHGWRIAATTRDGRDGSIAFSDRERVGFELAEATHILSSVPPADNSDPVLETYGDAIARSGAWIGYLSSTGVYGDAGGAWVSEDAPTGTGRRVARAQADTDWLALPNAHVFRLPGIYGPGRSVLDRIREGKATRIDAGDQVFSRIHVDDLVEGVVAGIDGPPGAYNLSDDLPAPQADVIAYGCRMLGVPVPDLVPLDDAAISPAARAFYSENRRVANGKAKRLLGWRPAYPDYRFGLRALNASTSPAMTSTAPAPVSGDQR
ncbi:Rossmann-fold NAD(P)-binding domain-containing protein [Stakelama tenebrarum]|uniref:NAD(P)-dependent oxidoreductase n=1 Tax=Stakelama tenebrarum TaxID=2711215 RepID=A0A6G6Y9N4_9SPHN|nr:NAD(P)-dependent oxidoreductase [Sphingosinithalassobacter tenebrarum]QIG81652.1 NAD(P)-dependent oxidoreductase [Sphingosinithalassobacter tenebrarum]